MDTIRLTNVAGFAQAYDGRLIRGVKKGWLTCRFQEQIDMDDFIEALQARCKLFGLNLDFDPEVEDPGHKFTITFHVEGT